MFCHPSPPDEKSKSPMSHQTSLSEEPAIGPENLWYPPGGILIWALVFMELLTFSVALIALMVSSRADPQLFHESRLMLNPAYGVINTIFLLTSGYFMATSLAHFKKGERQLSQRYLWLTILGGLLFLALKSVEYQEKISHGLTLEYNTFFTYYWLTTCFHVLHVLVGLVILGTFSFLLSRPHRELALEDFEAGAGFWHMCDLIWLILFPTLYLIL